MIINISNIGSTGGGGSDVDEKLKQIEEKINQIDEKLLVYISSADDSNVNIIKVSNKTKAQYDAIEYKDDNTLYLINEEENFIKFSTNGDDACSVSLTNNGGNAPVMEYSTDGATWQSWNYTPINFDKNTPVYFRGMNEAGFSSGAYSISSFNLTGSNVSVDGNVMSLINYETLPDTIPSRCFVTLFQNCSSIISVSEDFLPATSLASGCYQGMFAGCTSLVNAPELPATTLADDCYQYMFKNCTSLVNAPELPAEYVPRNAYIEMFNNCKSLVNIPNLPATTLTDGCYSGMFSGCTSLVNAPALPATTLASNCYNQMFFGCSSLVNAPALPATTLASNCYFGMFQGCSSLVNAPELPATTLVNSCYSQMFAWCKKINEIHCNAIDLSASNCTKSWLYDVSPTGTFYKNPNATDWIIDYHGIPSGWTVVDETI